MLEGALGSLVAKTVCSVACAFGLFGGLAVTGVLPVIGNNAADTVVVDAIAVVDTPEQITAVNPVVEVPGVGGIVSQVPAVAELTGGLPNIDGVVSNYGSPGAGVPVVGLAGALLSSLTGTVDAVLASVPVVNRLVPAVPVVGEIALPATSPASVPGLDLVSQTLDTVPNTVTSVAYPAGLGLTRTVDSLPLAGELLRSAQGAVFALVPGLLVIVE